MSRPCCSRCHYPTFTCVCGALTQVNNAIQVVVLQHPSEVKVAKGTARLLSLALNNMQLFVGEQAQDFEQARRYLADFEGQIMLLYPSDDSVAIAQSSRDGGQRTLLLVIDATWKKAYKIWQSNPWLAQYPQLRLSGIDGQYRIRKAASANALSTLEATAYALNELDGSDPKPLLHLFDYFIDRQMAAMPHQVKQRYPSKGE
ncbi:tRNA-uridine aminocarboxypropyltransferase [Paraferrimonas haliotis]|uniref:tRNA-uridine aminocarboxypropyltransferase n=1 Tax=Paraferrimonas haliotis TaxID=2013866 RepID=A0AA37TK76_9GAMM|nr:tRNA-uridine aminocarboxypropyltransferase [Paraferrimonas haliotis]GLS82093.1 DTW domain-containing protein [Paraferrimonas haliotis]